MITRKKFWDCVVECLLVLSLVITINSCTEKSDVSSIKVGVSSENSILAESIVRLTRQATGKTPEIISNGSVSLTQLACRGELDAIAIADEMWPNVICPDANWVNVSDSLYQSRVQFALPTAKAKELGWQDRIVKRAEVLKALKAGQLKLATTLPTYSNSGYNTLLWLTREELGSNLSVEQITPEALASLQPIYQNLAQSSESTAYLAEKLTQQWQPNTLAALYRFLYTPDGTGLYLDEQKVILSTPVSLIEVSPAINVTPTWFVTTEVPEIKQKLITQVFERLQPTNPQIFRQIQRLNPPLSVEVQKETTPITNIHRNLLNNFPASIRQKRWMIGIVDASGSMKGEGWKQLLAAFSQILEPAKAKQNFLYAPEDRFSLIVYQDNNAYPVSANELSREKLYLKLKEVQVGGGTPVEQGLEVGLDSALKVPPEYQLEVFLFTDGQFANPLNNKIMTMYEQLKLKGAEFTIVGAGNIDNRELERLAKNLEARPIVTNSAGQTLEELLKAFREAQI